MRHLLQPRVLNLASLAAALSALACYPRLTLWSSHAIPIWYLLVMIFLCSIILWGFVFAWHTQYTRRPIFIFKLESRFFAAVTLIGILAATGFHLWLDPSLRKIMPKEYPEDLKHWFAMLLFAVALNQLFQVYAPFAWSMRLFKNIKVATTLTVAFGVFVLLLKIAAAPTAVPSPLLAILLVGRTVMGFLTVSIYLRGGLIAASWWTFLFEARHLLTLSGNP